MVDHVIPSGDVAPEAVFAAPVVPSATKTKADPFHAMHFEFQYKVELGRVLSVHVMPSGEVMQTLVLSAHAQKTVPFQITPRHEWLLESVRDVHVMPSGDVAPLVELLATDVKTLPFHAIPDHDADAGIVRDVHVIPSGDVAAEVTPPTAQKTVPFQITSRQLTEAGSVRDVHVIPSVDVAATAELSSTATKIVPFHAMAFHWPLEGRAAACSVQIMPSGEVMVFCPLLGTAQ